MFDNLNKRPLNFAHRGFTLKEPENSLSAFTEAVKLGVNGIELDVRTCKSGEVIVFHDPTVNRLTDGRGFIKNKTLEELKELRLRNRLGALTQERIPTLQETLELLSGKVFVNVEIKTNGLPKTNFERKVVEILRKHHMENKSIVSSFNPLVVRRFRKIDGGIVTGYLIDKNFNIRRSEILLTKMTGARAVHIDKSLATEELIGKIHKFDFHCFVWTVNDPEEMTRLAELGVTAIISDRPDILKEQMRLHTVHD